ncbi:MAG: M23 family metallopeptidase [Clostridiales bacterium]|nr:M23 family metallopeptidase [Clostridiales bacterium]
MGKFFKKYGVYMLALSLILAVGIMAGTTPANEQLPDVSEPAGSTPLEMVCPMSDAEVLKWYSDTELFYNSTLKQWESHKAVDLCSSASNDVYSVLDGIVTNCSYSYEDGYCITITHQDGLATTYCSLAKTDAIKQGDIVSRGQKIGEASNTSSNEGLEGNHLHFAISLNGKSVDPSNYITFENK